MPDFDFDLIVIGGGSGGVRGARTAAALGARVLLVESGALGGTCVNVGCVPKKLLSYGAHFREDLDDMAAYGWTVDGPVRFDWPTLIRAKDKEISRLNGIYADLLDRAGVEVVRGRAVVEGPHGIRVGERRYRGRYLLVAVGGRPWRPSPAELPGVEHTWTSDDLFVLPSLPRRLLVVGGGYIACEFASVLHGLGVEVHLAYRGELLLRGFDDCVRHELGNELRKKGVHLHFSCAPSRVERLADGALRVTMDDGDTVETDGVLMATGRVPNTAGLGLEQAGVHLGEDGAVLVDDAFQTSAPSVYAVGDVIDRIQLTPVALAEAMVVARALFAHQAGEMDYRDVPSAVFTSPPVATVGLTAEEAARRGPVKLFRSLFRPLKHTLTGRDEKTLVKLVVDAATDRVLGVHVVGADAPEIVQGFAVALKCGATKAQFDATIGIHPTSAEELVTLRQEWVPTPRAD